MTEVALNTDFKLSIIYFHRQITGYYFIWFNKLKKTPDFHKIHVYVDSQVMTVYVCMWAMATLEGHKNADEPSMFT
jgi:hypothetical protein